MTTNPGVASTRSDRTQRSKSQRVSQRRGRIQKRLAAYSAMAGAVTATNGGHVHAEVVTTLFPDIIIRDENDGFMDYGSNLNVDINGDGVVDFVVKNTRTLSDSSRYLAARVIGGSYVSYASVNLNDNAILLSNR